MANKYDYKKLLAAEVAKLELLLGRRKDLKDELSKVNSEAARLREGVIGLAALAGVDLKSQKPELFTATIKADIGLTDAIREVLKQADMALTTTDIRDELSDTGYPIHEHKNPLASVHSILKRLVDAGQVVVATDTERQKTVYLWHNSFEGKQLLMKEGEVEE